MKNTKLLVIAGLLISQIAYADDLVPATSEDQDAFSEQLDRAEKLNAEIKAKRSGTETAEAAKSRKENFGQLVSVEAKKLKDATLDGKKGMGSAISTLKRKNKTQAPVVDNSSADSNASSVGKDGRNSAPNLNNSGGAPSQPGQSGNRNKLK